MATPDETREDRPFGRPDPDPTELTSRAVNALRSELTNLFNEKLKSQIELTDERFKSTQEGVATAERLRLEQKVDTKTGLDAALAAQKESAANQAASFAAETAKTERNFTEQLKAQRETFGTSIAGQSNRYDDLDKRVTRIESIRLGGQESTAEQRAAANQIRNVIAFGISLILAAIVIIGTIIAAKTGAPAP